MQHLDQFGGCSFLIPVLAIMTSPTAINKLVVLQLYGHAKTSNLDRGRVLFSRQQHTVRFYVSMHDIIIVTVPQCLQDLSHVVAAREHSASLTCVLRIVHCATSGISNSELKLNY